jgi:hypothetical protein
MRYPVWVFFFKCPAQPVRRSAQDDGFAGRLKKNIPNKLVIVGLLAFLAPLTSKFALA